MINISVTEPIFYTVTSTSCDKEHMDFCGILNSKKIPYKVNVSEMSTTVQYCIKVKGKYKAEVLNLFEEPESHLKPHMM